MEKKLQRISKIEPLQIDKIEKKKQLKKKIEKNSPTIDLIVLYIENNEINKNSEKI